MEISVASILTVAGSLLLYFAKWYHDHNTIQDLKKSKFDKEDRLKKIESELLKLDEALNRTYVSAEYLYNSFYDKDDIDMKLQHLKELAKAKGCK